MIMPPTARDMQPKHFMLLSHLPCEEREKIYQKALLLYSDYMLACYHAKELLATGLNELFDITEEDENKE